MLSFLGELLFTIAIGYMGAIEFLFVLKHLYHWSFQHHRRMVMLHERGDDESLKELQEYIQKSIDEAGKEEIPGFQRMKDGIFYKDGFRVDPNIVNKIAREKTNQSIKREIIGSSENRLDEKEKEIAEKLIVNTSTGKENKNIVEDTFINKQEKIQIQEEIDLKKNFKSNESSVSQDDKDKIEVKEEIIIKEQVPPITSSIPPQKQSEQSYSIELDNTHEEIPDQDDENERINLTQTVKTQFGQTNIEQYSLRSPPKQKIGISDDSSSNEPWSSQKSSSLSTQQSSSLDTTMPVPEMHFDEYERQAPDGEDVPTELHYSEEYLRSLDGIKNRPLIRDDGSGRRRAFKKRRSSGDSTSSRESRHSREEEVKMFTSLEEEEFATMKNGPDGTAGEYTPIRYSSDPNLKVNKPLRRRKRSPAQDSGGLDKLGSNSLEMLGEEDTNPWGDVKPEHYKDTEFWKREKSNSIPEELEETGIPACEHDSDNSIPEDSTRNVSTLPTVKNIPKMSSFEEATHSQHEKAISILKNQGSKDVVEPKNDDRKITNDEKCTSDETKNVSSDEICAEISQTLAEKIAFASAFNEHKTSQETDEVACNQPYDHSESHSTGSGLRRSPRMDEIDHYEERWEQEERRKSSSLTPSEQQSDESATAANQNLPSLEIKSKSLSRSVTPEKIEVKITYEPLIEHREIITAEQPSTPTIEIDYASDDDSDGKKVKIQIEEDTVDDYDEDIEQEIPIDIMAGLSDFYDFNASINPPRTRSTSLRRSKSAEPLSTSPTVSRSKSPVTPEIEEPYKYLKRSPSPSISASPPKMQNISCLSDFYDFNVNLNQQAYNRPSVQSDQDTHRDSINMIIEDLEKLQSQYKLENLDSDTELSLQIDRLKNEIVEIRDVPVNNLSPVTPDTPDYPSNLLEITPQTPDYSRSFSTELRDVERLKEEIITGGFKRSTYVGESADFSDDFEELREQTRNFRRSQSKSRSPIIKNNDFSIQTNRNTAKKELQERILEEITRTTVNFQDFSRDLTKDFLEHERRVSDSALIIQKPEILIQFEDDLDELEPEEYHHFRRFSIQQEYPVEEYPMDDIIYVDQIEVTTTEGVTETWQRDDTYTSEDKGIFSGMPDLHTSDDKGLSKENIDVVLCNTYTSENQGGCSQLDKRFSDDTYISEKKDSLKQMNKTDDSEEYKGSYDHVEDDVTDETDTTGDKNTLSHMDESILDNTSDDEKNCKNMNENVLEETYSAEDKTTFNKIDETVAYETEHEHQRNLNDELHETDSNSSDDRQTIVEVDDGIDVDVLDYNERTEESYNEQSECEEYERTIDHYANSNINDWKDEGAVGGITDEEFDQMYDEAIKDRKQSGIQRDYDGIVENITDEKIMEFDDTISIRTEDLLEEILKADEEKYGWYRSRASSRESNRSLFDGTEHRYLADAVSQSISSTRLRSRYGLAPATGSYANFENYEDVDLNYKPKREYNWRKNFKIDDDNYDDKNNDNVRTNNKRYKLTRNNNIDMYDDTENVLDPRKHSSGGESITLFSRSPENSENCEDLENVPEENINNIQSDKTFFREDNQEHNEKHTGNIEEENFQNIFETEKSTTTDIQMEEIEKISKRKKPKKKLRKGSKGSLCNDDENCYSRRESLIDSEISDNLEEVQKKKKKKRRVKESISIEEATEYNVNDKLSEILQENIESLTNCDKKQTENRTESLTITYSHIENNSKAETPEAITSPDISSYVSPTTETESISVESVTPKSMDSINLTSHSVSTSSDSSSKSQKLDIIESSDIIELIKDSSILGSSF